MRRKFYPQVSAKAVVGAVLLWGAFLLVPAGSAQAANVTVGCAGAVGTFDFTSLQAAVNAVPDGSQITVSGTCTEFVQIFDFENLRLTGTAGATLIDPGPNVPDRNAVLVITQSINVVVRGFTLRGSGPGGRTLTIVADSLASFEQCTFERASTALFLNQSATVSVVSSTIQDNRRAARVSGSSVMRVGPLSGSAPSVVQRNGSGILVDENAQFFLDGASIIQDNTGAGISVEGARVRLCCGQGQRKILNNGLGIVVRSGSIDMIGPALIEGNRIAGLVLIGSSAGLFGGQTIRNTGTAGGIVALGNSHLELFSSEVRNNVGSGVVLRENSSARIFNNTITGNGGNGVRVIRLSTARLFAPNTITGNGNFDFFCAPNSFASGDKTGVGRMFCPKFDQSPEPMLGPKPDQP